ncbi:arylsulfatase [Flagellimonas sp. CMM7]|uniref:sulfatase family protein n=1 Tax=Flagellimonas sp. CMM7 TaxID=2654676 RepID=UPI0013D76EB0|nr:arylsulfatase [Flagellimonas sp. CMM7]UII78741.1 arylsulfatase [Flagellimonas sp. CMM7]
MKFIKYEFCVLWILSLCPLSSCTTKEEKANPNIIIILADDFGVGYIQAHYPDNKIPTLYLDKLVQGGMSFNDAYSKSGVCSPSRYSLLTGRYNWRTPLQEWVLAPYEPPLIKTERTTLLEYLQSEGYHTACIGKWHLGWNWVGEQPSTWEEKKHILKDSVWYFDQELSGGPLDHGFDYYFCTDVPNFPSFTFIENNKILIQPTSKLDLKTNVSARFTSKIFDGYQMAPEWQFDQILLDITKKAVDFISEEAKKDNPFFLYFSITSPHEPVSSSKQFLGKSSIAPVADFVMEPDWSLGQIIEAVKAANISENTLIIFTADNGHTPYTGWKKLIEAGHYPSGSYRGYKGNIWEGGHRVPMIAYWSEKITSGIENSAIIFQTDFYATIHELVSDNQVNVEKAEDSFSFLNLLKDEGADPKQKTMVNHSRNGEFAYRKGKLVFRIPGKDLKSSRGELAKVALYNLEKDISETENVAQNYAELVEELTEELRVIVDNGTSYKKKVLNNNVKVDFKTIQKHRWLLLN